jgi:2-keto-4-pentenoate hydratase/2-oxohepta-3-ene-1,7-dioic acid hydratase in catechol pathway
MHWLRFRHAGRERFGTLAGEHVVVFEGDLFAAPVATGESLPLAQIEWLTPCRPSKLIGLWNNFRAAAAKNGWGIPAEPLWFVKTANSYLAHGQPIPQPAGYDGRVMYEGELGVVIGRRCKAVSEAEAPGYIFGYTCVDDVTAAELIGRDASFAQWSHAKSFDGFGPFGPVIATGLDPHALVVRTLINGRERQNYPLSDAIFSPAQLVSRISRSITLEPGDLIACGTSLGVLPVKPGSTIEVSIEGIGTLRNAYGGAHLA